MSISDELQKLQAMHARGELTDDEYARAKAVLLTSGAAAQEPAAAEPDLSVDPDRDLVPARLRVMQIVAGALVVGVVVFLAIVLFMVQVQNGGRGLGPPGDLPIISLVFVAMSAVQVPLSFLLPLLMGRGHLKRIADGTWTPPPPQAGVAVPYPGLYTTAGSKLLAGWFSSLLVGLALLEGAAFFGCIAYLLEAQPWALAVVAVIVLLMLLRFPTAARVRAWLERQGEALAALRA